jgi:hypothetical protein
VLAEYVGHQLDGELAREWPGLHGALEAAMHQRWHDWQSHAQRFIETDSRQYLYESLLPGMVSAS